MFHICVMMYEENDFHHFSLNFNFNININYDMCETSAIPMPNCICHFFLESLKNIPIILIAHTIFFLCMLYL